MPVLETGLWGWELEIAVHPPWQLGLNEACFQCVEKMLVIDKGLCQGCGRCSMICFMRAISLESGRSEIDQEKCNLCGLCVGECKQGAITQAED